MSEFKSCDDCPTAEQIRSNLGDYIYSNMQLVKERDSLKAIAAKLAESINEWLEATSANRKNGRAANYESFALRCDKALSGMEKALAEYKTLTQDGHGERKGENDP